MAEAAVSQYDDLSIGLFDSAFIIDNTIHCIRAVMNLLRDWKGFGPAICTCILLKEE
jgi:hypothetical protein